MHVFSKFVMIGKPDNDSKKHVGQQKVADEMLTLEKDQFNVVVEAALVGIYIIQDGLFRYVNPTLARIFGYQPEELIDHIHVLDLIHPADRERVAMRIRQRTDGQLPPTPHLARGISKNGQIIHFESLAKAVTFQGRPAIIGTLVNITAFMLAQEEIRKHRQELQRLSAQLIAAREAESKRISQELHDVIGQSLTAVSINLAQIKQDLPENVPPIILERLMKSETLTTQTLAQTRKLSLELRPSMLDELGLLPTLRWYIHEFGHRLKIVTSFKSHGIRQRFSPELKTVLYRVVQEGLTNVARHAKAGQVDVSLDCQAGWLILTITDDGIGFDVEQLYQSENIDDRLGLLGIDERISLFAGRLHINSAPGKGTQLKITFSCPQSANVCGQLSEKGTL